MARFLEHRAAILEKLGLFFGKPLGWERVARRVVPFEACGRLPARWVQREGVNFLCQPWVPIGYNLLLFGSYEPQVRDVIRRNLPRGGVAVDAGANVGWHTLLMASLAGERGRVLAIEANPSVRQRLETHCAKNGAGNVTIVPFALGSRQGTLRFVAPPADSCGAGDGHVVQVDGGDLDRVMDVECVTLDGLVESERLSRLDLLKVDVEGFEFPALEGAKRAIAKFRPVIIFEFDAAYAGRGGGGPDLMRGLFKELGYDVSVICRKGLRALQAEAWPDCANLVASPRG